MIKLTGGEAVASDDLSWLCSVNWSMTG